MYLSEVLSLYLTILHFNHELINISIFPLPNHSPTLSTINVFGKIQSMIYALIPIFLLYTIIKQYSDHSGVYSVTDSSSLYESISLAICIWALILLTATEVLSCFKMLYRLPLFLFWIAIDVVLSYLLYRSLYKSKKHFKDSFGPEITILNNVSNNATIYKAANALIIVTLLFVLIFDALTVPYNWDSMTYHLPRIMFWAQNHSIAHYATYDIRQLSSPYFSEYINLHQYIIIGNDIFFNYIQGLSFCFCALSVYFISKELHLDFKWRLVAVILFISTPITFAESLTTQVDLLTTVWMLIFVYYWIKLIILDKLTLSAQPLLYISVIGSCIGLAYITKPSACVAMAVFSIVLLIYRIVKGDSFKILLISFTIVAVFVFLITFPGILRNIVSFHSISSSNVGQRQLVGTIDPRYLLVNFVKNLCFTLPSAWLRKSEKIFYTVAMLFARLMNVNMDNPLISEDGHPYSVDGNDVLGHDTANNNFIVWLTIITFIIALIRFIKDKNRHFDPYIFSSFFSYILFLFILRWEPFETRYQISFLALLCPAICKILKETVCKNQTIHISIISIISFICLSTLLNLSIFHASEWHSKASSRPQGYFGYNQIYDNWKEVTDLINASGYSTLGMYSGNAYYSYPIWRMCDNINRIETIIPYANDSSKYIDRSFHPDAILWFGSDLNTDTFIWNDAAYKTVYSKGDYHLLERE